MATRLPKPRRSDWNRKSPSRVWLLLALVAAVVALVWWIKNSGDGGKDEIPDLSVRRQAEKEANSASEKQQDEGNPSKPSESVISEPESSEAPLAQAPESDLTAAEILAGLIGTDAEKWHQLSSKVTSGLHALDVQAVLLEEAESLADQIAFSRDDARGFEFRAVGKGGSYWTVARGARKEFGHPITMGTLMALNGISPKSLHPDTKLKVPTKPIQILVDKSEFRLYLLMDGKVLRAFPIGIGKDDRTPEGDFTITAKAKNPDWRDPRTGRLFKYGQPGHLIGDRWMGFKKGRDVTHFGIHGTVDPTSIGDAVSDGCIRMGTEDLSFLFDFVGDGVPVHIRP